jgi:hypothetical protein
MTDLVDRRGAWRAAGRMLTVVAAGAGAGWLAGRQASGGGGDAAARLLRQCLALAEDSQRLRTDLRSRLGGAQGADAALLPGYLALIRQDGVPAHAALRQGLDRIATNDAALAALLVAHGPAARTADFGTQAEAFRDYASAWRDRWNALTELLMAGGVYPVLEPAPPAALIEVLRAELVAAA